MIIEAVIAGLVAGLTLTVTLSLMARFGWLNVTVETPQKWEDVAERFDALATACSTLIERMSDHAAKPQVEHVDGYDEEDADEEGEEEDEAEARDRVEVHTERHGKSVITEPTWVDGGLVRLFRLLNGLTQGDLAALLDYSSTHTALASNWENGNKEVSPEDFFKLVRLMDIDPDRLKTDEPTTARRLKGVTGRTFVLDRDAIRQEIEKQYGTRAAFCRENDIPASRVGNWFESTRTRASTNWDYITDVADALDIHPQEIMEYKGKLPWYDGEKGEKKAT